MPPSLSILIKSMTLRDKKTESYQPGSNVERRLVKLVVAVQQETEAASRQQALKKIITFSLFYS